MSDRPRIGQILLKSRLITQRDLDDALAADQGGRLCSRLHQLGRASETDLVRALSAQFGVIGVDLSETSFPTATLQGFPVEVARRQLVLPLKVEGDTLVLAMANPLDQQTLTEIKFVTSMQVEPRVALERSLLETIDAAYAALDSGATWWFGSRADREGTTIGGLIAEIDGSIELHEEPAARPLVLEEEHHDAPGARILVVDDEEPICELCRAALEKNGYVVETATRGLEALEKIKTFDPNLVLLDAMLPEVHGFEVCRKIKQSKKFGSVPVIMMSAVYTGWRYAADARESYGADDYIEKPFRVAELLKKVEERLAAGTVADEAAPELTGDADAHYRQGVELFKTGQFLDAAREFEAAAAVEPSSARLHFSIGRAWEAAGDAYRAMKAYETAVDLRPDLFPALKALASLYQQKGFRRKAIEAFERAVPAAPDDPTREEIKRALLSLL